MPAPACSGAGSPSTRKVRSGSPSSVAGVTTTAVPLLADSVRLRDEAEGGGVDILDRRVYPHQIRWVHCTHRRRRGDGDPRHGDAELWTGVRRERRSRASPRGRRATCPPARRPTPCAQRGRCWRPLARRTTTSATSWRRCWRCSSSPPRPPAGEPLVAAVTAAAAAVDARYRESSAALGRHTAELIPDGARVLTHCWADQFLIGAVTAAQQAGKTLEFVCTETRPYLQGARLTAATLVEMGYTPTLITDGMVATVLASGSVDVLLTAADRVTLDGHVVNKVGTLTAALAASHFGVPYYAMVDHPDPHAPTIGDVHIEERDGDEVLVFAGQRTAADGVVGRYPAFDATPPELVTKIVTDRGAFEPAEVGELLRVTAGRSSSTSRARRARPPRSTSASTTTPGRGSSRGSRPTPATREVAAAVAATIADARARHPALSTADVVAVLHSWMDADVKATPLKTLQGQIWAAGFGGRRVGMPTSSPTSALGCAAWHADGVAIAVFSSGSVASQRAWFAHTDAGDLSELIVGYFDTVNAGAEARPRVVRRDRRGARRRAGTRCCSSRTCPPSSTRPSPPDGGRSACAASANLPRHGTSAPTRSWLRSPRSSRDGAGPRGAARRRRAPGGRGGPVQRAGLDAGDVGQPVRSAPHATRCCSPSRPAGATRVSCDQTTSPSSTPGARRCTCRGSSRCGRRPKPACTPTWRRSRGAVGRPRPHAERRRGRAIAGRTVSSCTTWRCSRRSTAARTTTWCACR